MHNKFQRATDALKDAFKDALDSDIIDENTLGEVWRHYQGMKRITKDLPPHTSDLATGPIFLSDGVDSNTFSVGDGPFAAGPTDRIWEGSDAISFGDISINTGDSDGTVTFTS
tara:strand:- start:35812 stop:36150 length:339 start_codon:yes stop_codon:yes gene_type:complete